MNKPRYSTGNQVEHHAGRRNKYCTVCKSIKPVDQFYPSKSNPDGFTANCKTCESRMVSERRKGDPRLLMLANIARKKSHAKRLSDEVAREEYNAQAAAKRRTEKSRAYSRERMRLNRARYKTQQKARLAVREALLSGVIVRPELCTSCGQTPKPRADGRSGMQAHHHNGYENALDVVWLCRKCHGKEHRKEFGIEEPK